MILNISKYIYQFDSFQFHKCYNSNIYLHDKVKRKTTEKMLKNQETKEDINI